MKPPEFLGGLNPVAAHDWLSGMERVFQDICYSEKDKAIFSAQMMKGLDIRCWDTTSAYLISQMIPKD